MATIHLTGKILLTLATLMYTFAPPIVDLSRTHATNPVWVSHARFHVVWQVMITTGIGLLSLWLLWFSGIGSTYSINLSFILGLIVLGSFVLNVGAKKFYAGTLSDSNGVPPIFKNVDANLFFFSLALGILLTGYFVV
jgi:hypothetical protein